jgi:hypothetical protein
MTALTRTERHNAQVALDRPMTLVEAGRRAERINSTLADLYEVAQQDVRLGKASPELWTAVCSVTEAKR